MQRREVERTKGCDEEGCRVRWRVGRGRPPARAGVPARLLSEGGSTAQGAGTGPGPPSGVGSVTRVAHIDHEPRGGLDAVT